MLRNLLEFSGIDPLRLQMSWVSASEGKKFADVVTEITRELKEIGPQNAYIREAV
jgi:F420-non-reducing hydrogenase iron-sulfur subunit